MLQYSATVAQYRRPVAARCWCAAHGGGQGRPLPASCRYIPLGGAGQHCRWDCACCDEAGRCGRVRCCWVAGLVSGDVRWVRALLCCVRSDTPCGMEAERRTPKPPRATGGEKPAGSHRAPTRRKRSGKPSHAEARAACMVRFPTQRQAASVSRMAYPCACACSF